MPKAINSTENFLVITILLTLPLLATIVLTSVLYYLDWPALGVGLIISYAAVYAVFLKNSGRVRPLIICFLLTIASLFLGSLFYDLSYDGRLHFGESIIQLLYGWNPTQTPIAVPSRWGSVIWCNKYPIGLELLSASIFKLTGSNQFGKGCFFILMLAGFAALSSVLRQKVSSGTANLCSAVLVVNPVVISQMWTAAVDGPMYLLFLIGFSLFLHVKKGDYFDSFLVARNCLGHLLLATALAIILVFPLIKISGFIYSFILYLVLIYQMRSRPYLILGLSLAGLALFIIAGHKPYFMYPLENLPPLLRAAANPLVSMLDGHGAIAKLFLNHFRSILVMEDMTSINSLFTYLVTHTEGNLNPFGLIYGLIWAWSIVYFFVLIIRGGRKELWRFESFIFLLSIIPPLIIPAFICQRYYPVQFLFPVVMLMRLYLSAKPAASKAAAVAMSLLLINPIVFFIDNIYANVVFTNHINSSLRELAERPERKYLQVAVTGFRSEDWSQAALSDRLLFKDLNVPIYMPTTVLSQYSAEKRFERGHESEIIPVVNQQGLMVIVDLSNQSDSSIRSPKIAKISVDNLNKATNIWGQPDSAIMMYIKENQQAPFSHAFDSYYRWRVYPARDEIFLDIPYYANLVIIVGTDHLFLKKAEIREVDYPTLITPEKLNP